MKRLSFFLFGAFVILAACSHQPAVAPSADGEDAREIPPPEARSEEAEQSSAVLTVPLEEASEEAKEPFPEGAEPENTDVISDTTPEEEPDNQQPQPQTQSFSLTAKQWVFEPETIRVKQGDTVRLSIQSIDVSHGFALPDFGINATLEPGKTETVEFVADKKGVFRFVCSVFCGAGHGDMQGTLIVE